jgi:hypothetical protein
MSTSGARTRRRTAAVALLLSVGLSLGAVPAGGSTDRCRSDNGTDVARYFDLHRTDPIWLNLQGRQPACVTVRGDRPFSRTHGWIAQQAEHAVYPADYTPARRAPMADFLSKLTRARYVISRDGEVEVTRTVHRTALLARAKLGRFGDLFVAPDTTLVPGVTIEAGAPEWTTLERFDPARLGPGEHTIEIYWTLSARHCDGFAPDPVNDCLPAGESLSTSTTFTITP